MEKTLLINYEEGHDNQYNFYHGKTACPESKDNLKHKDRLVVYGIDFTRTHNGAHYVFAWC